MNDTRELAEFCTKIAYEQLAPEVVGKAKLCVLDFFANVHGALRLDAVRRVEGWVRSMGESGNATALGCGFETGMQPAAFLNGTAGEAVEAQDGLRFGGNHPGVAVIPAALAAAETRGLGGREVIEAVIAGYEVADRVAAAMHPHHTMSGFLPTGTCGAFGAAAAVSKLMGHDAETTLNSLSIAGYLAPVSMAEHLMGGFTSKIVQGGQAASAGLAAAGLAGAGLTGTPFVLEGSQLKGGFTQITCKSAPDLTKITGGLGEHFSIMDIYLKPYTSCRHTHGAAQAALELVAEQQLKADDIESVDVFTYAIAAFAVGRQLSPGAAFVSAQFSLPYVVAACLTDGDMGPAQLRDDRISDAAIAALAGKIKIHTDSTLSGMYPDKTASRVEIKMKDGRALARQVDMPLGDPRNPMDEDAVSRKFRRFAPEMDTRKIDGIARMTMALEDVKNIKELTRIV